MSAADEPTFPKGEDDTGEDRDTGIPALWEHAVAGKVGQEKAVSEAEGVGVGWGWGGN